MTLMTDKFRITLYSDVTSFIERHNIQIGIHIYFINRKTG